MYSNTRQRGKLVTWKDDRGFGFLQCDRDRSKVFIHISDIRNATRRPQVGDIIEYNLATNEAGKTKAVNAIIDRLPVTAQTASPPKNTLKNKRTSRKPIDRSSSSNRKNRTAIGLRLFPILGLVAIVGYGFQTLLSSTLAPKTSPTAVETPSSQPSVNPAPRPPQPSVQPSSITPAEDVSAIEEIPAEPNPSLPIDPVEIQRRLTETTFSNYQCTGKTYCSQMTSCEEAKFYLQNCPNVQIDGNGDGVPCESQWCN
ncbi:MAG: excalibur calcium-binding domain-containing protein [Geitlerinemataceae cyanobacterium]